MCDVVVAGDGVGEMTGDGFALPSTAFDVNEDDILGCGNL